MSEVQYLTPTRIKHPFKSGTNLEIDPATNLPIVGKNQFWRFTPQSERRFDSDYHQLALIETSEVVRRFFHAPVTKTVETVIETSPVPVSSILNAATLSYHAAFVLYMVELKFGVNSPEVIAQYAGDYPPKKAE
jgi:hypothetical protein